MKLDDAPKANAEDNEKECDICGSTGTYVLYDNDKVCRECGHVPSAADNTSESDGNVPEEWREWWSHRSAHYDGFYGPERVKMVGGFASAY